jgi:hypothetical protein
MVRPTSFLSSQQRPQSTRAPRKFGGGVTAVTGVTDFLRSHDRLAALLPAVARIARLQKECSAILPALFDVCSVMQFEAGNLVLSAPNAALATKLKQQLPKVQESLLNRGWQVNAIRIKVQVGKIVEKKPQQKQLVLPDRALSALSDLNNSLEDSPQNQALKNAVAAMLQRHRKTP